MFFIYTIHTKVIGQGSIDDSQFGKLEYEITQKYISCLMPFFPCSIKKVQLFDENNIEVDFKKLSEQNQAYLKVAKSDATLPHFAKFGAFYFIGALWLLVSIGLMYGKMSKERISKAKLTNQALEEAFTKNAIVGLYFGADMVDNSEVPSKKLDCNWYKITKVMEDTVWINMLNEKADFVQVHNYLPSDLSTSTESIKISKQNLKEGTLLEYQNESTNYIANTVYFFKL
jgi:hypothetical protein